MLRMLKHASFRRLIRQSGGSGGPSNPDDLKWSKGRKSRGGTTADGISRSSQSRNLAEDQRVVPGVPRPFTDSSCPTVLVYTK